MNDEDVKKNGRVLVAIVFGLFAYFFGMHYAHADFVARDQVGNIVRLYDKPCTDVKILRFINDRGGKGDRFRAGFMHYQGIDYGTCWMNGPDGYIYVVDSDGDLSRIPMSAFVRETGV